MMKQWSTDVVLLTDGNSQIPLELEARLRRHQIAISQSRLRRWKALMMARCNLSDCRAVRGSNETPCSSPQAAAKLRSFQRR